jgi:hypothetical protein
MNNTVQIFCGAFADEQGQRFLRVMQESCDATFSELHDHNTQAPDRYRGCLGRVASWDPSVIAAEVRRLDAQFPDVHSIFRGVYVHYVKAMRASKTTRLIVSPPKLQVYLHRLFTHFSRHPFVTNPRYFETSSILEKRITCMDVIRDALYEFLGEEYVRAAPAPASPTAPAPPTSVARDDNASRVVSDVFENETEWREPVKHTNEDDDDSISPNDSVSCVDFAEKQQRQLQRMRVTGSDALAPSIAENEDESTMESRTSLSLSSVSLTEQGPVVKQQRRGTSETSASTRHSIQEKTQEDDDRGSNASYQSSSVASSQPSLPKKEKKRKTASQRSYITTLTEDSTYG